MSTSFNLNDPAVLAQVNALLAQQGGRLLGSGGQPVESSTGTSVAVTPSRKRSRSDIADTERVVDPTTTDQSPERKKKRAEKRAAKAARKAAKAAAEAKKAEEEAEQVRKAAEAEEAARKEAEAEADRRRAEAEEEARKEAEEEAERAENRRRQEEAVQEGLKKVLANAVTRRPGPSEASSSRPRFLPPVPTVEVSGPPKSVRKVQGRRIEEAKRKRGGQTLKFRMGTGGHKCQACVAADVVCAPNPSKFQSTHIRTS